MDVSRYAITRKFDDGVSTRYSYRTDFSDISRLCVTVPPPMSVSYFKRFRMELDLRGKHFAPVFVPSGYRLVPWDPELLAEHAAAKYQSFRDEIDADIFNCLAELDGCQRLMQEISLKDGFLPEATWLAVYSHDGEADCCGTIQGIRATQKYGAIQNVGITPSHRGRGVGSALIAAALSGFQQVGLTRAYLEVTAQNDRAVQLYKRLGFRRTKTLFKAVELAYS
jgi:ribosomal protein S18 acetylase RimI-like enzyme